MYGKNVREFDGPRTPEPPNPRTLWALVFVVCVWAPSVGCARNEAPKTLERGDGRGQVVLYLNGQSRTGVDIIIDLAGIRIQRDSGEWQDTAIPARRLGSLALIGEQVLLGQVEIPAGRYAAIEIGIGKAQVRQAGRILDLALPTDPPRLALPFVLGPGETVPLFVTWDADQSVEQEIFFRPRFGIETKAQELRGVVAYVTNEESDDLSVIDRSTNRVVSAIHVGRGPRGVVVAPDTRQAYVVNSGSHSVTVIDVNTNRVLHEFNLETGARPQEALITPNGQTLYVSNAALNSVSAIDVSSSQVIAVLSVGTEPTGMAMDPRGARVFVANTGSGSVTAIDTFGQRVVGTVQVEPRPTRIAVDATGSRLFVASEGSAFLQVLSTASLQVQRRVSVGLAASAILPDVAGGRVFVARKSADRVSLYDPNLNVEVSSIGVGKGPHHLALDADRGKLYVVNQLANTVSVVDRASRRVEGTIPVGKRPYAIALVR